MKAWIFLNSFGDVFQTPVADNWGSIGCRLEMMVGATFTSYLAACQVSHLGEWDIFKYFYMA